MAKSFSMESLNAAQRKAVQTLQGPVLILAGAGTGKTRTVTCRIAHMVDRGISPKSILAVTFTNKAALEMRERVGQMVERKAARQIMVSTFHSLCVRILREDIGRLGYKTNFTIYSGSEQSGLIRRLIVRHGGITEKITPKDVLSSMSRMKNSGLGLDSIEDNLTANIAASYQRELQAQNSVDFDDLLILADKLLKEHRDVREAWQQRFRYITVDEFQDTNSLQMSLLGHLVGPEHNVCVVGDDDQSIYGWRGAQISNILEFERFFPNPSIIKLEENYRCTAPILDTANALIRHNLGRRDKTLRAHKGGGEAVRLISMPGDAEEAEFIITDIENVRRQEGRPWEDFAILFRANTQSRIIEQTLREHKIPYRMVGAQSFFDRKEVKDLISYLATIENPQADEYLLRILNTPPRGISELTSHLAIDWSREHGNSVWAALQDEEFLAALSTRARNSVQAFNELIAKYIDLFQDKETDFGDILEQLIEETGFSEYVTRLCKTEAEIQKRLVSIGDVKASLRNFWQPGKTLRDYLAQVTLDKEDNDDDVENKPGVCLITMHAAKGLEFPVVYLVGLEEGILPHKRSLEDGNCDEERRLLYVGITRAQEKLMLTYCATRLRYGDRMPCQRSSFLSEIPPHLMEYSKWEDLMNAEATEEESGNFFDSLRRRLIGIERFADLYEQSAIIRHGFLQLGYFSRSGKRSGGGASFFCAAACNRSRGPQDISVQRNAHDGVACSARKEQRMIQPVEYGGASKQAFDRFFIFSLKLHKPGGRAQEAFRPFQHTNRFRIERPAVYRSQRQKRRSAVSPLFQIFDRLFGVLLRLGYNILVCLTKRRFNCGFIFCRDAQNLRYGAANAPSKVRIRFAQ